LVSESTPRRSQARAEPAAWAWARRVALGRAPSLSPHTPAAPGVQGYRRSFTVARDDNPHGSESAGSLHRTACTTRRGGGRGAALDAHADR